MYLGGFLVGIFSIGILKIGVMFLSVWLLWKIQQGRSGRPKANLRVLARAEHGVTGKFLFWGLFAFFISELTCGIEVYILLGPNAPLRLAHSFSSALGAALLLYGILMAFDHRVLYYFDESHPCVLFPVCKSCPRRTGQACKFHPTFFWSLCFLVLIAVPLFFIPVRELIADPTVIALPSKSLNGFFDQEVVPLLERYLPHWKQESMYFVIPKEMTLVEFRYIPIASIAFGVSALVLSFSKKRANLSFMLACFSAGPLMYAYLEATLFNMIPQVYLGSLGHEIAEILGLVVLRSILYELLRGSH